MDNAYQHSTIAQIIENILELYTFEGDSQSNIADILLSILNKTEYNEDPHSVIGDLLIRLKAKIEGESYDPYDAAYTSRIAEILISILEETEYTEEPQSRIAELLLELKEELEAYTELTASGSVASFITNVVKPLVNGEFTIAAYQEGSGNPSPDNKRNFVPFNKVNITKTGKNLLNADDYYSAYKSGNSYIGTGNNFDTINIPISVFIGQQITFSAYLKAITTNNIRVYASIGGTVIEGNRIASGEEGYSVVTITPTTENDFIKITYGSGRTGTMEASQIQLEVSSVRTDYNPYKGEVKTVDLGEDTYGAVYNSVTGGKKITHVKDIIDGNNLQISGVFGATTNGYAVYINVGLLGYARSNCISNKFKYTEGAYNRMPLYSMGGTSGAQSTFTMILPSTVTSATEANQWFRDNPVEVNFKLLTPIESTGTPTPINTFNGSNNIFCDTGDTSVTYLYKGTPPETVTRAMSKSPIVEDIIKEEKLENLKDLDELQNLDISDKEVK